MSEICLRDCDQASIRRLIRGDFEFEGAPLPRAVLLAVARLIPCDAIGVGEVDPAGYLISAMVVPPDASAEVAPHVCHGQLSTALEHTAPPRHEGPRLLVNSVYGVMDRLTVGFGVAGSRNVIQLCLDRRHETFSERDVALLAMLQPALDRIVSTRPRPSSPTCLSRCERRVLELVAAGASNREVATRLSITVATVRKHLEHVYRKLGVTNRTAAAAAYAGSLQPPTGPGTGRAAKDSPKGECVQ